MIGDRKWRADRRLRSTRGGLNWFSAAVLRSVNLPVLLATAVLSLDSIGVTVSNLAQTERFYREAFDFKTVERATHDDPQLARLLGVEGARLQKLVMRLGAQQVEFIQFDAAGRPYPKDSRSPDLWFQHFAVVVSDMEKAYARVSKLGPVPISVGGPQTLPPQNGDVKAYKFRDPDGHPLELLYFPPGQGRSIWHDQPADRLFLGIDHAAITVADTARSTAFYGRMLGMTVVSEVRNRGPTQEALDGTSNAVVQITTLRPRASEGPGIEFLNYIMPSTGRSAPMDARSNDVAHVHLTLRLDDLDDALRTIEHWHAQVASPGVVTLANGERAVMLVDPDGHKLVLRETLKGK